eukprot:31704-Amphidinium_carterae.1
MKSTWSTFGAKGTSGHWPLQPRVSLATQVARATSILQQRATRMGGGRRLTSFIVESVPDGNESLEDSEQTSSTSTSSTADPPSMPAFFRQQLEVGHPPAVWCSSWDSSGTKVVVGSRDGSVRIWRLRAREPM